MRCKIKEKDEYSKEYCEHHEATTNSQTESAQSANSCDPLPEEKIARLRAEFRANKDDIHEIIMEGSTGQNNLARMPLY